MSQAEPTEPLPPLVADAMVIHHFAKADRLDVLGATLSNLFTTHIVAREVDKYRKDYPSLRSVTDLEWLHVLPQDTDEELIAFEKWANLLGSKETDSRSEEPDPGPQEHNLGEASVFAAAEIHKLVAITDDRDATRVGRKNGLDIHGTV